MSEHKSRRKNIGGGGLGLPTILLIIFIILKLTKVIDWNWGWVLSPLWISASLGVLFLLFIGFILFIALIGLVSQSSSLIVGIKRWFGRIDSEDTNVENEEASDP